MLRRASGLSVLAQTGLISGSQSFVFALEVSTPGTLSVRLADLNWQGKLSGLSFSLANAAGLVEAVKDLSPVSASAAGRVVAHNSALQMFEVASPGTYYAYVSGTAAGRYGLGLYGLNATFAPAAVPLPASLWLLLSGLGGLVRLARRRTKGSPQPSPQDSSSGLLAAA